MPLLIWFADDGGGVSVIAVDTHGVQYAVPDNRVQYSIIDNRLQFKVPDNKVHITSQTPDTGDR